MIQQPELEGSSLKMISKQVIIVSVWICWDLSNEKKIPFTHDRL